MMLPAVEVEYSYRACEDITRVAAANFYYGIRLLPREKRQAMSAVYAFARRVDDIGDGNDAPSSKLAALDEQRASLATVANGASESMAGSENGDAVTVALAHARERFDLPLEALRLLIDGVELDVRDTRYETFDDLVVYCRDVAGSIGRLCLAIFTAGEGNGSTHPPDPAHAAQLADDLGVAMQLTNILRDVREDYGRGRVYLPAEDLRRFDCSSLPQVSPDLVRFEAQRAAEWFDRGLLLIDVLDSRSASCVLAMTGIYRRILERITREPTEILRRRISLPAWEKAWLAARSLAGVRA
ncbi:MAG TPA: squalene/phytoene synthase family protein [Solirubrobacteraceae bacterium]|nr:squalene/phytoene synthase family protein [Solirubrobacteraceae bacterium]